MRKTILKKLQLKAREEIGHYLQYATYSEEDFENKLSELDTLIANTLKQAAEEIATLERKLYWQNQPITYRDEGYNQALKDAQKLLLGEDNEN